MMAMKDGRGLLDQLTKGEQIVVEMDWREAIPHPDNRVEWVRIRVLTCHAHLPCTPAQ